MRRFLLLWTAMVLLAGPAWAGVTLVMERSEHGQTHPILIQLDATHARFETTGGGQEPRVLLFDAPTKTIRVLDPGKKAYFEINSESAKRIRDHLQGVSPEVRAMIAERLKSLPPRQRAQAEAVLAQQGGGAEGAATAPQRDLQFVATGEKKEVNGLACAVYRVSDAGKPYEEDCIAAWGAPGLSQDDLTAMKKLAEAFSDGTARGGMDALQEITRYPGVPIQRARLGADGQVETVDTVKSIRRGALSPAVFAVPAGYQRQASPGSH